MDLRFTVSTHNHACHLFSTIFVDNIHFAFAIRHFIAY